MPEPIDLQDNSAIITFTNVGANRVTVRVDTFQFVGALEAAAVGERIAYGPLVEVVRAVVGPLDGVTDPDLYSIGRHVLARLESSGNG